MKMGLVDEFQTEAMTVYQAGRRSPAQQVGPGRARDVGEEQNPASFWNLGGRLGARAGRDGASWRPASARGASPWLCACRAFPGNRRRRRRNVLNSAGPVTSRSPWRRPVGTSLRGSGGGVWTQHTPPSDPSPTRAPGEAEPQLGRQVWRQVCWGLDEAPLSSCCSPAGPGALTIRHLPLSSLPARLLHPANQIGSFVIQTTSEKMPSRPPKLK